MSACTWCGAADPLPCTVRAAHPTTGRAFPMPCADHAGRVRASGQPAGCSAGGGCAEPVAYLTNRGWLTCAQHRPTRDRYTSARLLTPTELRRLATTGTLRRVAVAR